MLAETNQKLKVINQEDLPGIVKNFGAMLSDEDRRVYFAIARDHYSFSGSIVDLGVYMGGTTAALMAGALNNPQYHAHKAPGTLVHAYDLFKLDWTGVEGANWYWPGNNYKEGDPILDIFKANLKPFVNSIAIHEGDIKNAEYRDDRHIEILGVDICKARDLTDAVIRIFFPRLEVGSFVIHQDYIHAWLPHIHVAMGFFADHFESVHECTDGETVVFRLTKPITRSDTERFSSECSDAPSQRWIQYFDEAMTRHIEPRTTVRLLPARALLIAEVHGVRAAETFAETVRDSLDDHGRKMLDEVLSYRRRVESETA